RPQRPELRRPPTPRLGVRPVMVAVMGCADHSQDAAGCFRTQGRLLALTTRVPPSRSVLHSPRSKQIGGVVPSVAVIGTRGYPSYYSGFETAVRKLAPYFAGAGWDVTVYGRRGATRPDDPDLNLRIVSRITGGLETKS